MTAWSEMRPVAFDAAGLNKKQRAVVATATHTLFPDLLPQPKTKPAPAPEPQIDGQADLFGDEA